MLRLLIGAGLALVSGSAIAQAPLPAEANVRAALERIARIDPSFTRYRRRPTAIDQARRVDAGGLRGPLAGQPVLIKDNIESAGPLPTTAGSLALEQQRHQPRCATGRAATRGGRGDRRQDQSSRMGEHPLQQLDFRLERGRRRGHNPWALDRDACGLPAGRARRSPPGWSGSAIGTETNGR